MASVKTPLYCTEKFSDNFHFLTENPLQSKKIGVDIWLLASFEINFYRKQAPGFILVDYPTRKNRSFQFKKYWLKS